MTLLLTQAHVNSNRAIRAAIRFPNHGITDHQSLPERDCVSRRQGCQTANKYLCAHLCGRKYCRSFRLLQVAQT